MGDPRMEQTEYMHTIRERPTQVETAVYLILASLAIGFVYSIQSIVGGRMQDIGFEILPAAMTIVIHLLIVTMIYKGKNWARMVYLILFIFSLPFITIHIIQKLSQHEQPHLWGVIQTGLQLIAVILLFQKPCNAWFKRQKAERSPEDTVYPSENH